MNTNVLEEIKHAHKGVVSSEDQEKYKSIGSQFYNMMNFEDLEHPTSTQNLLYSMNIINKTNNIMDKYNPNDLKTQKIV